MTSACTTLRATSHRRRAILAFALLLSIPAALHAVETCTTQSGLAEPERDAIAEAARSLASKVQANDAAGLKSNSISEVTKDFGGLQYLVAVTAPKLAGGTATLDQLYLLDASTLKRNQDLSPTDAQFFCSLNRSTMEADFLIPSLPPGKYAFAIVNITGTPQPFRLSFLMRQEPAGAPQARWLLAGFYPKPLTAAGHDGLWYWNQARQFTKEKQPWNAWLDYQAAWLLLRPTEFLVSTHLDKLRTEQATNAPPALSDGISPDAPLVVKGLNGAEYHFTNLTVDDSLAQPSLDIAAHLHADPLTDPVEARKRNADAMAALLAAYPELRKPFHGVWIYAETTGQAPFATEQPMSEIK